MNLFCNLGTSGFSFGNAQKTENTASSGMFQFGATSNQQNNDTARNNAFGAQTANPPPFGQSASSNSFNFGNAAQTPSAGFTFG